MRPGAPELLIILTIVILLFGVGRVGKIAGELGRGIREFRRGLSGDDAQAEQSKEKDEAS
jgi:sec-independent protein translocase protein TatA